MPRVIVRLSGGLGNQLFQYAFGLYFAKLSGELVEFDIQFYKSAGNHKLNRKYVLPYLGLYCKESSKFKADIWSGRCKGILHRIISKIIWGQVDYYLEFPECELKVYESLVAPIYFDGIFQNVDIVNAVIEDMKINIIPDFSTSDSFLKYKDLICATNSVAIHVRRGDYANDPKTTSKHGLLSMEYYELARELMTKEFSDLTWFIFSDDPSYVNSAFSHWRDIEVVNLSGKLSENQDVEEFFLMSFCKHQVIANSTFSWWAAMLNQNPKKRVFYPSIWYTDKEDQRIGDLLRVDDWKAL